MIRNGAAFLAEALALGSGVEATLRQERRDQETFVDDGVVTGAEVRTQLPVRMEPEGAREALERAGVNFHDGKPASNILFDWVVLPPGWKKVPTDHPWLSMLVDGCAVLGNGEPLFCHIMTMTDDQHGGLSHIKPKTAWNSCFLHINGVDKIFKMCYT